jgi:hypothetical protein
MNIKLKEYKKNSNKQMNENKKTMHDMKEGINKDMQILKNNQSEMDSLISQIKISIKILVNRVEPD